MKRHDQFVIDAQVKILKIKKVEYIGGNHVLADLITEQFGRRYDKRHYFSREVWEMIKERGYIE